ncbi:SMR family transporter [Cupriavidus basilensis]
MESMDIAVAYAMWGAIGIMGTASCGWLLFGRRRQARATCRRARSLAIARA